MVTRFHYQDHQQFKAHLTDLMAACNFARRLKTQTGLSRCEFTCKIRTLEPERFTLDPIRQMSGRNTLCV